MRNAEILVVGLGAMGSAALYHLARSGVTAVGIEQFQIGHALGSSHGYSRIYRNFYNDPLYVELAEAALPLLAGNSKLSPAKNFCTSPDCSTLHVPITETSKNEWA